MTAPLFVLALFLAAVLAFPAPAPEPEAPAKPPVVVMRFHGPGTPPAIDGVRVQAVAEGYFYISAGEEQAEAARKAMIGAGFNLVNSWRQK